MVDELTRYYMRKQNLKVRDEYHERITPSDIDELHKATAYAMAAPIVTGLIVFGYSRLREEGGASSHFAHAISKARSRFQTQPGGKSGQPKKWPSKRGDKTLAEEDIEQSLNQSEGGAVANVY